MKYHYLKTAIIARALIIALIGFYISLFVLREWLLSPIWLVAVFCILPYAIIYFHRHWKYGFALIIILSIRLGFYLGWNTYLGLSFITALIGFYQASHTIHEDVHNKIKVSAYDIFTGESVGKFVTYMTMVYVFTFVGFYQTFDLTCNDLYRYSNKMVDVVLLRSGTPFEAKIQGYIDDFFTTNVDTLLLGNIDTITHLPIPIEENHSKPSNDRGAKYRIPTTIDNNTNINHSVPQGHNSSILQLLLKYRQDLLSQTIDESDSIEEGVCATIIGQIKDKYNDPNFKLSVIFLMYLLVRPPIEISLHIISYINRAFFSLMFKLGWFKKTEDREVSEKLE